MTGYTELPGGDIVPKLAPDEVKVFLAEDSPQKREAILQSLGEFGMDHSVTIATTMGEAEEFIRAQEPHALTANVFLLDGSLSPHEDRILRDGSDLASMLFTKYFGPLRTVARGAQEALKELGLTRAETETIVVPDALRQIALRQLHGEALIAGVSRVSNGSISYAAQLPWIQYKQAGEEVFNTVVPPKVRKRLERQKGYEAHLARQAAQETSDNPAAEQ